MLIQVQNQKKAIGVDWLKLMFRIVHIFRNQRYAAGRVTDDKKPRMEHGLNTETD
jgi:hypothetical protein